MTLAETSRIDIMAQSPEGEIFLVIVAAEDWSKKKQMLHELSDKIHTYVSYIKSGEYKKRFGASPAKIQLTTHYKPTNAAKKLVRKASTRTKIPIEIEIKSFPSFFDPGTPKVRFER